MNVTTFRAMGTTVEAWLSGVSEPLVDWFEEVESVCSRFRPDSELSAINSGVSWPVAVSPVMAGVLSAAVLARTITGGLVDVGVGSVVAGWGYDRTFHDVADVCARPVQDFEIDWDFRDRRVTLMPGTALDLGGLAKGWACDRAVESGLCAVVSAGGDIRSEDDATVAVVVDPWGQEVARVAVGRGAMATSSVARRRWKVGSREVSHLMDPRTREPVESPVLSATVLAGDAVEAEIGAKAVLIHGVDGLAWADAQDWIESAIVVWADGSVYATVGTELAA
jgi:thiamine biosynthesis lipoprotein